jgi:PiT family inorganic phosphate transporter
VTVTLLVFAAVAALAWANGANDVSKGIATLVGSGVTGYRQATMWGALWTAAGAAVATVATAAMLATLGSGLLGAGVSPTLAAGLAAIAGAAGWVLLATGAGLPVSTTHAIVGAVAGSAVAAYGLGGVAWLSLVSRVALPLALTPLAALVLGRLTSHVVRASGPSAAGHVDCLCLAAEVQLVPAAVMTSSSVHPLAPAPILSLTTGPTATCATASPRALRITADHLHWLSSGAVSFARGLNDAPKIVALALAAALAPPATDLPIAALFAIVTVAMVAGSVAGGRRVTRLLAEGVTPMNHREGLAANGVTALLVTTGAVFGLPMSTTHVSSGSIIGVGTARDSVAWGTVRAMALAWVLTLPAAAVLGAGAYAAVSLVAR